MIEIDNIPKSGILIVNVYFEGYKDNYQNDTRRRLEDIMDKICDKLNLDVKIVPITFSLMRTVTGGYTRATGAHYQYGYSNMTSEDLVKIYGELKSKSKPWWKRIQFLIADDVGGLA